jgi:hypothetical protein
MSRRGPIDDASVARRSQRRDRRQLLDRVVGISLNSLFNIQLSSTGNPIGREATALGRPPIQVKRRQPTGWR